jgi:acetyl esterase/lipase
MTVLGRRDFLAMGGAWCSMPSSAGETASAKLLRAWTAAESFAIWPADDWRPNFLRNIAQPRLHVFRATRANGRAFLVVPGGAYAFNSVHNEGLQIAERMNALGLTVFVLTYRLPAEGWTARSDVPLQDAQRALRVIRARATHFGIDAGTVSIVFRRRSRRATTSRSTSARTTRMTRARVLSPRPWCTRSSP